MNRFYLFVLKEDYALQDLIIAKIEVHGLNTNSLTSLLDYLKSQKQRVKIETSNSVWSDEKGGIKEVDYPHKSILGFLLFNVFINILMQLKLVTTVILLGWQLKLKNSFARKTSYIFVLKIRKIVFSRNK